jgi:hypothetical protein
METTIPEVSATLIALGDGTASIYWSSGGGIIGGGTHPSINAAARHLVHLAGDQLSAMASASDFPYPAIGHVRFYVLTTRGVVTIDATQEALAAPSHPFFALYKAGHEVISGLRKLDEQDGS